MVAAGGRGRRHRCVVAVVGLAEHGREEPRDATEDEREPERDAADGPFGVGRDVDDDRDEAGEHGEHADPRGRAPLVAVAADQPDDGAGRDR